MRKQTFTKKLRGLSLPTEQVRQNRNWPRDFSPCNFLLIFFVFLAFVLLLNISGTKVSQALKFEGQEGAILDKIEFSKTKGGTVGDPNNLVIISGVKGENNYDVASIEYVKSVVVGGQEGVGLWKCSNVVNGVCQAGSSVTLQNTSWNAGIGTTNPGEKLEVAGNIKLSGDIYKGGTQWTYPIDLPNTTGSAQWVKLGTLTIAQQGKSAFIKVVSNTGYSFSTNDQNFEVYIRFKTSNASSVDANGFCADSSYYTIGRNSQFATSGRIKWKANAAGCDAAAYDLYMYFGNYTGSASFYTVESSEGVWTHSGATGQTDPGAGSSTVQLATQEFNVRSNSLVVDSNGKVGIGATNPGAKLDVRGQIGAQSWLSLWNTGAVGTLAGGDARAAITFGGTDSALGWYIGAVSSATAATTDLGFYKWSGTGAGWNMVLQNGNVGIGVTGPATKLDINGNLQANSFYDREDTGYYLDPHVGSGTALRINSGLAQVNSASTNYFAGKVGIGTTSPGEKLAVKGNVMIGDSDSWVSSTTTGDLAVEGNVGIGVTGPIYKLDVAGVSRIGTDVLIAGRTNEIWTQRNTNGVATLYINYRGYADGTTQFRNTCIYNGKGGLIACFDGTTSNVGIGVTNPGYKLDVNGTGHIASRITLDSANYREHALISRSGNGYYLTQSGTSGLIEAYGSTDNFDIFGGKLKIYTSGNLNVNSGQLYVQQSTGNVGIGVTNPGAKLEVAGQIKITGGTPGAGKVLTSDAVGLATWQTPSSLPSGTPGQTLRHDGTNWVANSIIYNNGTNVGIGTTSLGEKLTIAGNILFNSNSGGTRQIIVGSETVEDKKGTSLLISAGVGGPQSASSMEGGAFTLKGGDGNSFGGGNGGNVYVYGGGKGTGVGASDGNVILAHTGSAARGAVGIGTTGPSSQLEVNGNVELTNLYDNDGSNFFDNSGLASQTLTGINSTGALTFTSIAISASQTTSGEFNEALVRKMESKDTRNNNYEPQTYTSAVQADFKANTTDGLSDGGTYHGVISYRPYGNTTDWTGGPMYQLGFTSNYNLWMRTSTGSTTWSSWKRILDTANIVKTSSTLQIDGTGNSYISGNVGIGTTGPGEKLTIAGNILFNSSSGGTRQIIVGDELASDINGTSLTISAGKGGPISSNPRVGGTLTLRGGDGNSTTGGDGGNVYVYGGSKGAFGTSNGNVILAHTGSGARGAVGIGTTSMGSAKLKVQGKITAEEFDPQYNIDGQTYATWALSTTGLREETVGKVKLSRIQNSKQEDIFQYEIDFDQVEKGSDLWLFKEITDFGKKGENLVVMLTAEGRAQVWYEFRAKENKLIIYGDGPVSVSYRLIALRFDHANHANLAPKEDQGGGIKIR